MDEHIPVDVRLIPSLPKDRAYSLVEAAFSYQHHLMNDTSDNISNLADKWGWSRNRVKGFIGTDESEKGQQKDSKRTVKGQVRVRFIKGLGYIKDSKRTTKGQRKDSDETLEHQDINTPKMPKKLEPAEHDKKLEYTKFVLLTAEEHSKLVTKMGGKLQNYIDQLHDYIEKLEFRKKGSGIKMYVSHYKTLCNWYDRKEAELNPTPKEVITKWE